MRNWDRLLDFRRPRQALPAALDARTAAASDTPLRVIATVDSPGKASIFDVATGQRSVAGPSAASPYRVELRDAAGKMLESAVPATTPVVAEGEPPSTLLEATVPSTPERATAVVISAGGRELARRDRSAHAPVARIAAQRPAWRVGRARTTLARWSAHDADGDRLTATVAYSADGGRDWKVVADDVCGTAARIPSRFLSGSRNARLRVRVTDGFDVATAVSGRLRATGAPPQVRILGPGRGGRVRADATLLIQRAAFDDVGRPLTGPHLRWYAGGRLIGRGELLTVRRLPARVKRIRLVATDAHGRSSQALLNIRVRAVRLTFLIARAPTQVKATARNVRITVASTVPAVLKIAGKRHGITRDPRRITIAVRPGRSTLRLKYTLSSAGAGLTPHPTPKTCSKRPAPRDPPYVCGCEPEVSR